MEIWKILNSPFTITIVSFLLGGVLASAISALWQRRSQRHAIRLQLMQDLLKAYHDYIRFLIREDTAEDKVEFDHLHAEMMSKVKIVRALFSKDVADRLIKLVNKMATVQQLRTTGAKQKVLNQRKEIYQEADKIIEELFLTLG